MISPNDINSGNSATNPKSGETVIEARLPVEKVWILSQRWMALAWRLQRARLSQL